jgi:hypothetical protein
MAVFWFKSMVYYDHEMVLDHVEADSLDEAYDAVYVLDRAEGTHVEVIVPATAEEAAAWDATEHHDWEL